MHKEQHLRPGGFIIEDVATAGSPGALVAIQSHVGLQGQTLLSAAMHICSAVSQQREYRLPSVSKHDDPVFLIVAAATSFETANRYENGIACEKGLH